MTPNEQVQPNLVGGIESDSPVVVPFHTHDGVNSPLLDFLKLLNLPASLAHTNEIANNSFYGDANLVSYYRLEDASDSKSSRNLGNNGGATFATAGKFNNGADFGASNSTKCLYLANNYGISTLGPMTVTLWVKVLAEPGEGVTYTLFNLRSLLGGKVDFGLRYQNPAGTKQLDWRRSRPSVANDNITYNVTLGTSIHHLAFTYDGTNIYGYLDGTDVTGAFACSGNGTGGADFLYLGAASLASEFSSVVLDDVAIFSRVLTPTEILSLYQG